MHGRLRRPRTRCRPRRRARSRPRIALASLPRSIQGTTGSAVKAGTMAKAGGDDAEPDDGKAELDRPVGGRDPDDQDQRLGQRHVGQERDQQTMVCALSATRGLGPSFMAPSRRHDVGLAHRREVPQLRRHFLHEQLHRAPALLAGRPSPSPTTISSVPKPPAAS